MPEATVEQEHVARCCVYRTRAGRVVEGYGILQPRIGMLATVRNRRGVVTGVSPHDGGPDGRLHLVSVEYVDGQLMHPLGHRPWEAVQRRLGGEQRFQIGLGQRLGIERSQALA